MKNKSHKPLKETRHTMEEEHSLKGTFVSVLILAAIMIVSWFSILLLFLERY